MRKYVIEVRAYLEVEAEDRREALDKAWGQIDKGNYEFSEPEIIKSERIDWTPPQRRYPSPYERTRALVYATGNKWQIENFEATHGW